LTASKGQESEQFVYFVESSRNLGYTRQCQFDPKRTKR